MPLHKTIDDYIDQCHQALKEKYRITIPRRIVKMMLSQFSLSVYINLKKQKTIDLKGKLTISPSYMSKKRVRMKQHS